MNATTTTTTATAIVTTIEDTFVVSRKSIERRNSMMQEIDALKKQNQPIDWKKYHVSTVCTILLEMTHFEDGTLAELELVVDKENCVVFAQCVFGNDSASSLTIQEYGVAKCDNPLAIDGTYTLDHNGTRYILHVQAGEQTDLSKFFLYDRKPKVDFWR